MSLNLVDPELDLIDPNPDIFEHFTRYNVLLFNGKLGGCEVKWSKRMTLCAGNCRYKPRTGECVISLSEPLLKLRPRSDFVNTLLHEMIHAYLFVTKRNQDRDGHGPEFQFWMNKINNTCNTLITIYHTFNAEVRHYKKHVWRCNGICSRRPPFWGYVRRSMNRAPSKNDIWWIEHEISCGGKFIKIDEPEDYKKKSTTKSGSCQNNVSNRMTVVNGILFSVEKPKSTFFLSNAGEKAKAIDIKSTSACSENISKQESFEDKPKSSFDERRKRKNTNLSGSQTPKKSSTSRNTKLPIGKQISIESFVTRTSKQNDIFCQENAGSSLKDEKDIVYLGTTSKGVKLGTGSSRSPSFLKKLHQARLERINKLT